MSEAFKNHWGNLLAEIMMTWHKLTLEDLYQINGDIFELEKILKKKYGYSTKESEGQVREFIQRYENLVFVGEWEIIENEILIYWSELDKNDTDQINQSRFRLIEMVMKKYGIQKDEATYEINKFLRQFFD